MSAFTDFQTAVYKMLEAIPGEDVTRPGLSDTPERVAKMFLSELTLGYSQNANDIIGRAVFEDNSDEMVVVKNIPFYSLCEHHMVPFFGEATIGYIPQDGRVLGLSKFARIVDVFARRLQIQEKLTGQISDALFLGKLRPEGVGVHMEAEHLCMAMRGARKPGSSTITSALRGSFREDPEVRSEWLSFVR